MTLVNAGHPLPLLYRSATGAVEEALSIDETGLPVGLVDDQKYATCTVQLESGDGLVVFSDGVSEAVDPKGRQLGTPALQTLLRGQPFAARATGERLLQSVRDHAAGCDQSDDITLVCLSRSQG